MHELIHRLVPRDDIAEVAVLEQIDHLDQLAVHVNAQPRHDLPRRQPEQPQPRSQHPLGLLPALEPQIGHL